MDLIKDGESAMGRSTVSAMKVLYFITVFVFASCKDGDRAPTKKEEHLFQERAIECQTIAFEIRQILSSKTKLEECKIKELLTDLRKKESLLKEKCSDISTENLVLFDQSKIHLTITRIASINPDDKCRGHFKMHDKVEGTTSYIIEIYDPTKISSRTFDWKFIETPRIVVKCGGSNKIEKMLLLPGEGFFSIENHPTITYRVQGWEQPKVMRMLPSTSGHSLFFPKKKIKTFLDEMVRSGEDPRVYIRATTSTGRSFTMEFSTGSFHDLESKCAQSP